MPNKTTKEITEIVIRVTGISSESMQTNCRCLGVIIGRHLITHYSHLVGGMSYSGCGGIFNKTKRTAFHSAQVIRFYRLTDSRFSPIIQAIDDELLVNLSKKKIRSIYRGMRVKAVGKLANEYKS